MIKFSLYFLLNLNFASIECVSFDHELSPGRTTRDLLHSTNGHIVQNPPRSKEKEGNRLQKKKRL